MRTGEEAASEGTRDYGAAHILFLDRTTGIETSSTCYPITRIQLLKVGDGLAAWKTFVVTNGEWSEEPVV